MNGAPIVNSSNVNDSSTSNANVAVIIDEDDVNAPANDTLTTFNGITIITGINAGTHAIVPAAYLSNNFDISYGLGTLNILPATLTVDANNITETYGNPVTFTSAVSGLQFDDSLSGVSNGIIQYTVLNNDQLPVTPPYAAGNYTVVPGGLGLLAPSDYMVNYFNGGLTINKASLSATADDKTRVYGDLNPTFTISYSGFVNGEGVSAITPPTAATSANPTSNFGNYAITLTGGSSDNYEINKTDGNLEITKASLIVEADLQFIERGSSLPVFTSTITGWKNNEQTTITSGPTYSVPPGCNQNAGVYNITVCCLSFPAITNYNVTYQSGLLYVNPKGGGAKKVKPVLDCVDTLINHPSGFNYVAKLRYENDNNTPVYVPLGADNFITALGNYSGNPPVVFLPGSYTFDIFFDGLKLTWSIKTYNGTQKSSSASEASSTSNKCNSGNLRLSQISQTGIELYPNPSSGFVNLHSSGFELMVNMVTVWDLTGRRYEVQVVGQGSDLNINCSSLTSGVYFVKIQTESEGFNLRFVKE